MFTAWRKSSRSGNQGNCVEVGTAPGLVGIRDSKDPAGGILAVPTDQWAEFIEAIKAGRFDS